MTPLDENCTTAQDQVQQAVLQGFALQKQCCKHFQVFSQRRSDAGTISNSVCGFTFAGINKKGDRNFAQDGEQGRRRGSMYYLT